MCLNIILKSVKNSCDWTVSIDNLIKTKLESISQKCEFLVLKMVYTSSNVRAMSKTHQMTSKQAAENAGAGKSRSQSSNMHFHQRRNVPLPQEQHPVAQNSRHKAHQQQQQHYYQYHEQRQQQHHQSAGQRQYAHDGNVSRQLMSLPAKPPIDVDNRHNNSATANDGNSSSDNSIVDEYNSDDDRHYNNNRSILNHHNCEPVDDIYMDALSEVRNQKVKSKTV